MKNVAKKDIVKGLKMLEDSVVKYEVEDESDKIGKFCEELAKLIVTKDNFKKHEEVIRKCLIKLPQRYLDVVDYGEAHRKGGDLLRRKPELKTQTELGGSEWKGADLEMLCELLKGNAIPTTTLGLGGNNIGDEGAVKIAESLMNNSTLTTLGLGSNNIGAEGAVKIAESLMNNSTLNTLGLDDNNIGESGKNKVREAWRGGSDDLYL